MDVEASFPAHGQHVGRGAMAVADQVVLGTGLPAIDRRGDCPGTPFLASMWLPSIAARDQSIWFTAFSFASRIWWTWSNTPASVQRSSRRQHVIPGPNPSFCGRSSHPIPVCNTNKMPCRHSRSGNSRGSGALSGQGGSTGSISFLRSSSTIHALLMTGERD